MVPKPTQSSSRQNVLFFLLITIAGSASILAAVYASTLHCQNWQEALQEHQFLPSTFANKKASAADETMRSTSSSSFFAQAAAVGRDDLTTAKQHNQVRRQFDLKAWKHKTDGGLTDKDRTFLGKVYGDAQSVFEFGLGESTFIASAVDVPYYAGIDSDAAWVSNARDKASNHFRFYLADIGPTGLWGFPNEVLPKQVLQYQIAPLMSESKPFDVYMVDGRFRIPTVLLCFLHASDRGANQSDTLVLMHDCPLKGTTPDSMYRVRHRPTYDMVKELLDLADHSGDALCAFRRKTSTTDEDIWNLWKEVRTRNE